MTAWDEFDAPAMSHFLQNALTATLPGRPAQRAMAHRLSYGRHHGPVPDQARRAAVLVALRWEENHWSVPAILRPDTMRSHAGQVSLPGGMVESDETPSQTALREFEEELGAACAGIHVVGQLSPVYVFVTDFEVTPVVAVCHEPQALAPNPYEVAEVIKLPLAELASPACRGQHTIERRGLTFTVPHIAVAGHRIWGATSLILAEFVAVLDSCLGLAVA
jgi:8-oxo-dGTP pyrophosphatase MutT (NUDIX family)